MKILPPKSHGASFCFPNQNNFPFWIGKRFSVNFNFIKRDHVCVDHVVMIRAKRDKVFNAICSSVPFWNYVVNRSDKGKATNNTLASVSYSCGIFSTPVSCSFYSSQLFFECFFSAFFRAIANPFPLQIGGSDLHRLAAILAGHFGPVIHRVFTASEFFSKPISAINRAKNSLINMWPSGKNPTAISAFMLSIFFSSASIVVTRNKSFSFIGLSTTPAFTKSICHI